MIRFISLLVLQFAVIAVHSIDTNQSSIWQWKCEQGKCVKHALAVDEKDQALSFQGCQVFCGVDSALWPKPTGQIDLGNFVLHINVNSIDVILSKPDSKASALFNKAAKRFKEIALAKQPSQSVLKPGGRSVMVTAYLEKPDITDITLSLNESYSLFVNEHSDGRLNVSLHADNFYGARHGLETLSQLIFYDDIRNEVQAVRDVKIEDAPKYSYRGVLLDTARNYFSVPSIKRTIDGMAASKLNTFHWHITDTHSFPFVSPLRPELAKIGAYSSKKVYTPDDIKEIVEYGKVRGVRILPEFDAPAHVGEGWQNTDFVECFKAEPWQTICVEPPCGQFNPTKPKLYDYLEDIYADMLDLFGSDIFHMGGDEVSVSCWNRTESIVDWMRKEKNWGVTEKDFMELWNVFQTQALERLSKHPRGKDMPIILWSSTLTNAEYVEKYLPKSKYIIQVWTKGNDKIIKQLLEKGYQLILSNYDALYLDCGFGAWVGAGNNWCSPYIDWKKVYDNSPNKIAGEDYKFLGSEVALWSEQADESSIDNRIWPRAAALAERLWTEPSTGWKNAEQRMLIHRERLVERGIAADTLVPEWCVQHEGSCYIS